MAESFEKSKEPCPCGKGLVINWVKEGDHPWGNWENYPWTELRCEECRAEKELRIPRYSEDQQSEIARIETEKRVLETAREHLYAAVTNAVFGTGLFKTKKAEWEALSAQKLFDGSYGMYLRRRGATVYDTIRWTLRTNGCLATAPVTSAPSSRQFVVGSPPWMPEQVRFVPILPDNKDYSFDRRRRSVMSRGFTRTHHAMRDGGGARLGAGV